MEGVTSKYMGQYIPDRISCYPQIVEQLDKLWHDVDAGLFGESAKTGAWFLSVKAVKEEFSKPE